MKITSDVRDGAALPVKGGTQTRNNQLQENPVIKSSPERLVDQQLQQSIISRLAMERSLGDALSIAQVSQSLIQKAIIVSSQLRNIASQAMITGRIDQAALSQAVSEIPGDVQREEPSVTAQLQRVVNMPRVELEKMNAAGDMKELRRIGEAMKDGNVPARAELDMLEGGLRERSVGTDSVISRISEVMGQRLSEYPGYSEKEIAPVITKTSQDIMENPKTALIAQANINREAILTFLD